MNATHRRFRWWPLIAAAVFLPFANGGASVPLAAWLAPIVLLRFVRTQPVWRGLGIAYALLVAALAVEFHGLVPVSGWPFVAVTAAAAIFSIVPYLLDRCLGPRLGDSLARLALFPLAATALQFVGSFGRFGSWGDLAYSQYGSLSLLQLASVTGLWGIDFLIFAAASVVNYVWDQGWQQSAEARRTAGGFAAILALVLLGGGARLTLSSSASKTVRIASLSHADVEPAPRGDQWSRIFGGTATPADRSALKAWSAAVADDLLARADREAAAGARLVFWDETGAAVLAEDEPALLARGAQLAARRRIYLGLALGTWTLGAPRPLQNKLVLIDPSGRVVLEYRKAHPVAYAETPWIAAGDGKLRGVDTPFGRITAIICADGDYPQLLAQAGRMSAAIVLDPSSDWRAIDPWHTRMAAFRAIEQGVTLVRQTSEGLSAVFDPRGVSLASMDHFETDDRVMVAQVPTAGVRTVYARLGDWFGWLCIVAAAGLIVVAARRRGR